MVLKNFVLFFLFMMQLRLSNAQEKVIIYELGDSIENCETNFKNLQNNWTVENITNADSYKLHSYCFIETISDNTRFRYYRNYFSGLEPVYASVEMESGGRGDGNSQERFHELYVEPGFIHTKIFDQRELPAKTRDLLSEEFKSKATDVYIRDFDIDTISLNYHFYKNINVKTSASPSSFGTVFGVSENFSVHNLASLDSISKNYLDIFVLKEKSFGELSMKEKRLVLLEKLMIERIGKQLIFNERVHIGDKVFLVDFEFKGKLYHNYVICSAETKKVVMDYFFNVIRVPLNYN